MAALVAKSYTNLEQLCEPYKINGKMYVKVRLTNGTPKVVRAYDEIEYSHLYPEVKIIKPAKSRRNVLGFGEAGFIWIFKGDTYSVIDWFRASPCRYAKLWGWYLPSDIELPDPLPVGIEPIKLNWDEVSVDEQLIADSGIQKIVDEKIYDPGVSEWVGKVGDKLTLTLTCDRAIEVVNMYGTSTIHTFHDEDGNIYTWTTNARSLTPGWTYEMSGKIKDLTTYRNVKQNVLTNCRIKNEWNNEENV
jgi:hypothetical protein